MSGIPAWAVRGAKVVCVERGEERNRGFVTYPVVGQVYTIRQVLDHPYGGAGIRLVEIENPALPYVVKAGDTPRKHEASWMLHRFQPVITRTLEQDSTMFRKLLQPKRVRIGETA